MADRPGVLLYFDDIEAVASALNDAELGSFLRGVIEYARYGVQPDFHDPSVRMAFAMFRSRLDRDKARYDDAILQRRHAVYCREAKKRGEEPLSFCDWRERSLSVDIERYPITTSVTTSVTTSATTSTSAEGGTGGGAEDADWETMRSRAIDMLRRVT